MVPLPTLVAASWGPHVQEEPRGSPNDRDGEETPHHGAPSDASKQASLVHHHSQTPISNAAPLSPEGRYEPSCCLAHRRRDRVSWGRRRWDRTGPGSVAAWVRRAGRGKPHSRLRPAPRGAHAGRRGLSRGAGGGRPVRHGLPDRAGRCHRRGRSVPGVAAGAGRGPLLGGDLAGQPERAPITGSAGGRVPPTADLPHAGERDPQPGRDDLRHRSGGPAAGGAGADGTSPGRLAHPAPRRGPSSLSRQRVCRMRALGLSGGTGRRAVVRLRQPQGWVACPSAAGARHAGESGAGRPAHGIDGAADPGRRHDGGHPPGGAGGRVARAVAHLLPPGSGRAPAGPCEGRAVGSRGGSPGALAANGPRPLAVLGIDPGVRFARRGGRPCAQPSETFAS